MSEESIYKNKSHNVIITHEELITIIEVIEDWLDNPPDGGDRPKIIGLKSSLEVLLDIDTEYVV